MTEEEIKAKEDEIAKREEELTKREEDAKAKEAEMQERTKQLEEEKADATELVKKAQDQFEKQMTELRGKYEARLKAREDVITQLAKGDDQPQKSDFVSKINARRQAQNKKW